MSTVSIYILEELEDHYLAIQALENIASGKSKVWTQEELEQDFDFYNLGKKPH